MFAERLACKIGSTVADPDRNKKDKNEISRRKKIKVIDAYILQRKILMDAKHTSHTNSDIDRSEKRNSSLLNWIWQVAN